MRLFKSILYLLFTILSLSYALAKPSLPYFLLGNGHTAVVPVTDIAKWLHLECSWQPQERMAVLSNSIHRLEIRDNSMTILIDGTTKTLDFPVVSFDGKLFVQPLIFHDFSAITVNYQKPKNEEEQAILRLENTKTGSTITFNLADLVYHMTADLIGDGDLEDIYGTRSFHTAVWIMRHQKTLWRESYEEEHATALLFGVYTCPIVSPRQHDFIIWSGVGGNYIGSTVLSMYHFNGEKVTDIMPDGISMNYTTAIGGTLVQRSRPHQPPTFIQYNSIAFRHSPSRYEAVWYRWNAHIGIYQRTLHRTTRRAYNVDYAEGRAAALRALGAKGIPFQKYFQSYPHFTPYLYDIYPIMNTHDT